jgi:hypothetical protein
MGLKAVYVRFHGRNPDSGPTPSLRRTQKSRRSQETGEAASNLGWSTDDRLDYWQLDTVEYLDTRKVTTYHPNKNNQ